MEFVVIDVETANPDFSSICQVGIAEFRDGKHVASWGSLVNPDDYFDEMNVSVHGIDEGMILGAPMWPEVHAQLEKWLKDKIVVSHTSFDKASVMRTCAKNGLIAHNNEWLDTARVVRRAWPEFSQRGYGLANITNHLGIKFQHHNATEDARAAGEVLLRAIELSGLTLNEWLIRAAQPINPDKSRIAQSGNVEGVLHGETIAFTGALSMVRQDAADAAAKVGCEVLTGVTKNTTILVVGDQDIQNLAGHTKSSKHRKAEDLIKKGQLIRILGESDFQRLIGLA